MTLTARPRSRSAQSSAYANQSQLSLFDILPILLSVNPISPSEPTEHTATDERTTLFDRASLFSLLATGLSLPNGKKGKLTANLTALRLIREWSSNPRPLSEAERVQLTQYIGWGELSALWDETAFSLYEISQQEGRPTTEEGDTYNRWGKTYGAARSELQTLLSETERAEAALSTVNAFYTSEFVIRAIWQLIERLGFTGGDILEPACGTGHFIGLMPLSIREMSRVTAVEKDPLSAAIFGALYPEVTTHNAGFETVRFEGETESGVFDLIIGNVPFGDFKVYDAENRDLSEYFIHNYFLSRSARLLRPGGLLALITTAGTMDSGGTAFRKALKSEGIELVGAVRLPSCAFSENAGTEVTTDIWVMQKRPALTTAYTISPFATHTFSHLVSVGNEVIDEEADEIARTLTINEYYAERPQMMLGRMAWADEVGKGGLYGADRQTLFLDNTAELAGRMQTAIESLPEGIYQVQNQLYSPFTRTKSRLDAFTKAVTIKKRVYKQSLIITQYEALKTAFRDLLGAEMAGKDDTICDALRQELSQQYREFTRNFGTLNRNRSLSFLEEWDSQFASVQALENVSRTDKTVSKAAIFTERVYTAGCEPDKVETLNDALQLSFYATGGIALPYMAQKLSKAPEWVRSELLRQELAYSDPDSGKLVERGTYLSGEVRDKLRAVESILVQQPAFTPNYKALLSVMPAPVPISLISFQLGSVWLPKAILIDFIGQALGLSVQVDYNTTAKEYQLKDHKGCSAKNEAAGTKERKGIDLVEAALNGRSIVVTKTVYVDGEKTEVKDVEATSAAVQAQEALQEQFVEFCQEGYAELIETVFNDRFNNFVPKTYSVPTVSGQPLAHYPGANPAIKLRKHQFKAAERIKDEDTMLAHVVGSGKAQPLTAKILTPTGWVKMGDLSLDDLVISQDGQATRVTGVFPQGEKEIFEVVFSDGSKTECCEEHLWLTQTYRERTFQQRGVKLGKHWNCGVPKVRTLAEIKITLQSSHLGAKNHSIPLVQPVQFVAKELQIDPYLLGVLLGDGGISSKDIRVSSADVEILDRIKTCLPETVEIHKIPKSVCDYKLTKKPGTGKINKITTALKSYGLMGSTSATKFVPSDFLFSGVEERILLLQGILDTDGTISKKSGSVVFSTVSAKLADNVTELVNGLGGVTSLRHKIKTFTYKGVKKTGKLVYELCLTLPNNIMPFTLTRKLQYWKPKSSYLPVRYVVKVTSVGMKSAQCIAVENPNHLYITDNYLVTHNTWSMISAAMELKRLGRVSKTIIAVQNSTVADFGRAWKKLYPSAFVYVPEKSDLEASNRKRFLQRIATNNFDGIVLPASFLKLIPDDPTDEEAFIQAEVARMGGKLDHLAPYSKKRSKTVKQINKAKLRVQARRKSQADRKRDQVLHFGQLGIDCLMIDECHSKKRLGFQTNRRNIKGIDTQGSQDALQALVKCRTVQRKGGRAVLSTGTPISNTMAEAWTMLRFIAPDRLSRLTLDTFDEFAGAFGQITPSFELTTSGQFKAVDRFAKFVNVPQLSALYRAQVDVVMNDDIEEFKTDNSLPQLKNGAFTSVILPQTPGVTAELSHIRSVLRWYEKLPAKDKKDNCHIPLVMFGQARKATLDIRLLRVNNPDEEGSKTNVAVDNILAKYHETNAFNGTQLVFADLFQSPAVTAAFLDEDERVPNPDFGQKRFNLFDDIKAKLIAAGIPESEVAIVPTDANKREPIFEKVRTGAIRVLLGTSERMGVGVNVQERLAAIHHLDAPARPTDFEQRNGRGIRQGNLLALWGIALEIFTYGVDKTLDATAYGRMAIKKKFINQVLQGNFTDATMADVSAEDDFMSMSFEGMMATLSGSQHALTYTIQKHELTRVQQQKKNWSRGLMDAQARVEKARFDISVTTRQLPQLSLEADLFNNQWSAEGITQVVVDGQTYRDGTGIDGWTAATERLFLYLQTNARRGKLATGSLQVNGLTFGLEVGLTGYTYNGKPEYGINYQWGLSLKGTVSCGAGFFTSLRASVNDVLEAPARAKASLNRAKSEETEFGLKVKVPFKKQAELERLEKEVTALTVLMEQETAECEL